MQLKRRGALLLASLSVLALAAAGCGHNTATSTGGATVAPNATDAVATVNGAPITQSQFFSQLQNYTPNLQNPAAVQPAGRTVMGQMVQNLLLVDFAKQQGVAPTDAEVDSQYNNFKMVQETRSTEPFEQVLQESGLTPEEFKEWQVRPQLARVKLLTKGVTVSDSDIKTYYDLHKTQFTTPDRAHIKRIALANKTDADQIYAQIKGGKSFEDFVAQSITKQPPDGDLKQWLPLDAKQNPALSPLVKAIQATNVGATAPPIPFQGTWWLVKVVDKKPKQVLTLDQVKDLVRFNVLEEKAAQNPQAASVDQQMRDYDSKLAKANKIAISLPGIQYTQLLDELKNPPAMPATAPPVGGPPAPGAGVRVLPPGGKAPSKP